MCIASPSVRILLRLLAFVGLVSWSQIALAGTCQNNIPASNPDSAYTVHGDGTATDNRSGLMWKVCSEGQSWSNDACTGTASTHTWAAALTLAESAAFAGHTDWRLPNLKELRSLVEECRINPNINDGVFPNTPNLFFWSGSPYLNDISRARGSNFYNGYDSYDLRSFPHPIRLVRGGQSSGANQPPVISNGSFGLAANQMAGSFNVADADGDTIKNIRLTLRGAGFYCRTGYLNGNYNQAINTGLINILTTDCAAEATQFTNGGGGVVSWELELYDSKGARATPATGTLNQQGSITVPQGSKMIWTDSITDFQIGTGYTLQFKMVDASNTVVTTYSSVGTINVTGVDVEMDGKRVVWFANGVANVTGFKPITAGSGHIEVTAPVQYVTAGTNSAAVAADTTWAGNLLSVLRPIKVLDAACPQMTIYFVRLTLSNGQDVGINGELQVAKKVLGQDLQWVSYQKTGPWVILNQTPISIGDTYQLRFKPTGTTDWLPVDEITHDERRACTTSVPSAQVVRSSAASKRPIILIPGILGSTLDSKHAEYPHMPKNICTEKSGDCDKLEFYYPLTGDILGWNELEEKLTAMGYKVYRAPWDWRQGSLNKAADTFLLPVIEKALGENPGWNRVDVIAHSMGGLVTRALIQNRGKGNLIDRFIMVGTPNGGSVNAYYLMSGADPLRLDNTLDAGAAAWVLPKVYTNTANNLFLTAGNGALVKDRWGDAEIDEQANISGYTAKYAETNNRRKVIKDLVPGGMNLLPLKEILFLVNHVGNVLSAPSVDNNSDLAALFVKGSTNLICETSPADQSMTSDVAQTAYTWLVLSNSESTIQAAHVTNAGSTSSTNMDDYVPMLDSNDADKLKIEMRSLKGDGTVPADWADDGLAALGECTKKGAGGSHAKMPSNDWVRERIFEILRLNRPGLVAPTAVAFAATDTAIEPPRLSIGLMGPFRGLLESTGGKFGDDGSATLQATLANGTYQTLDSLMTLGAVPFVADTYTVSVQPATGFTGRWVPLEIVSNVNGVYRRIKAGLLKSDGVDVIRFIVTALGNLQIIDRPRMPVNIRAGFTADQQQTLVSWDAPTDPSTTGYRVYGREEGKLNFSLVATLSASQNTYTHNGAAIASSSTTPAMEFVVVAIDAQGRESLAPSIVSNTMQEAIVPVVFADKIAIQADTWVQSDPVTITGINVPVAISVAGGEYSIDGGTFTAEAGNVRAGQLVVVRVKSSTTAGQTNLAMLTIGNETTSFSVTYTPPVAPSAPILTRLIAGDGSLRLIFTPPTSDGGASINSYTATCTSNGGTRTASGAASPLTVTGLTNGLVYACSVSATNSAGTSTASASFSLAVIRRSNIAPILNILLD